MPDAIDTLRDAAHGHADGDELAHAVEVLVRDRGVSPYWANGRHDRAPGPCEWHVHVHRGNSEGLILAVESYEGDGRDRRQAQVKTLDTSRTAHRELYAVAEAVAAILNGIDG